jgi:hypothetical protein
MKEKADVDVEKRLLEDAASFTRGAASLDEEGFISRTLAALGITKNTGTSRTVRSGASWAGPSWRRSTTGASEGKGL